MPRKKDDDTKRPTPRNVRRAVNLKRALELRIAGATFDQIAEQGLFADKTAAHRAISRELSRATAPVEELRELMSRRLERLLLGVWPAAAAGDLAAGEQARRYIAELIKLHGLAAPVHTDLSVTVVELAAQEAARAAASDAQRYLAGLALLPELGSGVAGPGDVEVTVLDDDEHGRDDDDYPQLNDDERES